MSWRLLFFAVLGTGSLYAGEQKPSRSFVQSLTLGTSNACSGSSLNFDSPTLSIDCSNNRVGIGDSGPDAKLEVLSSQGTGEYVVAITSQNDTTGNILAIMGNGNVGLGVTNPGARLHISSGDIIINGGQVGVPFSIGVTTFVVQSDGDVGIGTTSPAEKLEVLGSQNSDITARVTNENTSSAASARLLVSVNGDSAGDPLLVYDIAGITGWSVGLDNSDSNSFKISNSASDVGASNRFTINSTGVGISTGNPAQRLDLGSNGTLLNTWDSSAVTGSMVSLDNSRNFTLLNATAGTNSNAYYANLSGNYNWGTHINSTGVGDYNLVSGVHGSSSVAVAIVIDDAANISTGILVYQAGMTTANSEQDIIRINAATRWQDDQPKGLFTGDFLDFRSSGAATTALFRVGSQGDLAIGTTMYVKSSMVGIGTTNPGSLLDVNGGSVTVRGSNAGINVEQGRIVSAGNSGDTTNTGHGVIIQNTGYGSHAGKYKLAVNNSVNRLDIRVNTNASGTFATETNLLTILQTGEVGVGITNPTSKIHISGDSNQTGVANFASSVTVRSQLLVTSTVDALQVSTLGLVKAGGVYTLASIQGAAPDLLGANVTCSNCALAYDVCVATGTGTNQWRLVGRSGGCL